MKTTLITGASGFIGQNICKFLSSDFNVIAFDKIGLKQSRKCKLTVVKGDITNQKEIALVCRKHHPDIIIHCAGIAHQKINSTLDTNAYDLVNHIATKNIAIEAIKANPNVYFIYLSSISVYGESHKSLEVSEEDSCEPTSSYALSKLNGEKSLIKMIGDKSLKKLDILRLAPVYDREWSLNIEKRVFAPKKLCYLRFGSGNQMLSILSRSNLIDFIEYRLKQEKHFLCFNIFNVCDTTPYSFNKIIRIFKRSQYQSKRWTLTIPLKLVWVGTRFLGKIIPDKSIWIYSCYDKLANSLVYDNAKMLGTGFKPVHTLETIFKK